MTELHVSHVTYHIDFTIVLFCRASIMHSTPSLSMLFSDNLEQGIREPRKRWCYFVVYALRTQTSIPTPCFLTALQNLLHYSPKLLQRHTVLDHAGKGASSCTPYIIGYQAVRTHSKRCYLWL